ncbi:MAG: hypothetical protein ACO2PK_02950 [Armatimonadota bacterium]
MTAFLSAAKRGWDERQWGLEWLLATTKTTAKTAANGEWRIASSELLERLRLLEWLLATTKTATTESVSRLTIRYSPPSKEVR